MVNGDDDDDDSRCPTLVLLCPAAEPNPGPTAWPYAFDSLANLFEKGLQLQRCASANRRSGQILYMFLEPFENLGGLETPPPPPPAAVVADVAVPSKTSPSSVVTNPSVVVKNKVAGKDDAVISGEKPVVTKKVATASKEGPESVASAPKRQKMK
jgi:hypothetical protein